MLVWPINKTVLSRFLSEWPGFNNPTAADHTEEKNKLFANIIWLGLIEKQQTLQDWLLFSTKL